VQKQTALNDDINELNITWFAYFQAKQNREIVEYCKNYFFSLNLNFAIFLCNKLLHFNLADFPVDFIQQFVSLWWWAIPKICMHFISWFYSNRKNMLTKYTRFTVIIPQWAMTKNLCVDQEWQYMASRQCHNIENIFDLLHCLSKPTIYKMMQCAQNFNWEPKYNTIET